MLRRLVLLAALAALVVVVTGTNAGAQDARPAASGCFGALITDDAGDQAPFGTNMDLKGGWFRFTKGKDGKPQLVADIQVANLDKAVTPGWNAHTWWVRFRVGDATQFVVGQLNSDGTWAYHYGADGSDGYAIEGASTGRVYEGADGIIEIDVKQKVAGKTLGQPHITSRPAMTLSGQPFLTPSSDRAPDSGGAEDWDAIPCDPVATAPTTPPVTTPATLDVTAGKAKLKGKTVSVALSGSATKLSARLLRGSRTVAKGRLASLAGKATLKLKASKKIKKGVYKLALAGTTSGGAKASKTLSVRVK